MPSRVLAVRRALVLSILLLLPSVAAGEEGAAAIPADRRAEVDRAERLQDEAEKLLDAGKDREAEEKASLALDIKQGALGSRHPALITAFQLLGAIHLERARKAPTMWNLAPALGYHRRSIAIAEETGVTVYEDGASDSYIAVARLLGPRGDQRLVSAALERAFLILEKHREPDHPDVIMTLTRSLEAMCNRTTGWGMEVHRLRGVGHATRLLARIEAKCGPESLEAAAALRLIGAGLRARDEEIPRARRALTRALEIRRARLRPNDMLVAESHLDLARHLLHVGEGALLTERLDAAREIWRKNGRDDFPRRHGEAELHPGIPLDPQLDPALPGRSRRADRLRRGEGGARGEGRADPEGDRRVPRGGARVRGGSGTRLPGAHGERAREGPGPAAGEVEPRVRGRSCAPRPGPPQPRSSGAGREGLRRLPARPETEAREATSPGGRHVLLPGLRALRRLPFRRVGEGLRTGDRDRGGEGGPKDIDSVRLRTNLAQVRYFGGDLDRANEALDVLFDALRADGPFRKTIEAAPEGMDEYHWLPGLRGVLRAIDRHEDEVFLSTKLAHLHANLKADDLYFSYLSGDLAGVLSQTRERVERQERMGARLVSDYYSPWLEKAQALLAVGAYEEGLAELFGVVEWLQSTGPS